MAVLLSERGLEIGVEYAAENEAVGLHRDDDLFEFFQRVRMDLVHQDDTAFARARRRHDVADVVVAVLRQYAAGEGFLGVDAAVLVEGPVAGVDVPADDLVAARAHQRVGLARRITVRVAEQLGRHVRRQHGLVAQHLVALRGGGDVVEVRMVPRVVADHLVAGGAHQRHQLRIFVDLLADHEEGGGDVVLLSSASISSVPSSDGPSSKVSATCMGGGAVAMSDSYLQLSSSSFGSTVSLSLRRLSACLRMWPVSSSTVCTWAVAGWLISTVVWPISAWAMAGSGAAAQASSRQVDRPARSRFMVGWGVM